MCPFIDDLSFGIFLRPENVVYKYFKCQCGYNVLIIQTLPKVNDRILVTVKENLKLNALN